jgi:acetylornithine deacetylase/succinyl-diaminopimelate desuccinylase family protein
MSNDRISSAVEKSRDSEISFLKDLVMIPTIVPPGARYEEAIGVIETKMKEIGFRCNTIEPDLSQLKMSGIRPGLLSGRRPNLIATRQWDSKGPHVLLNGHIDVVPPGDGWKYPPFSGTVKDNLMFGRGTADMKGSIASMIFALSALSVLEVELQGKVTLMITVDEEVGGAAGLQYLVKRKLVAGNCCLVADSSIESIKYAANGCLRFRIITYGEAAHSSRPWTGTNAIEKMLKIMNLITERSEQLSAVRSRVPVHPSFGVTQLRPSMSMDVISGGTKVNMIPDRCEVLVDRRIIPEEDVVDEAKKIVNAICDLRKNDPKLLVSVDYNHFHESFKSDPSNKAIKLLSAAYRDVTHESPFLGGTLGCTDACYTAKIGIPTMMLGCARANSNTHGKNEFVDLNDVVLFSKILGVFLKEMFTENH